ncbi:hypothetical protein C8R44DRAFT_847342 [Mycena epipterygia]|nr:hypothetical protein C8R44DRAFT_847342 [Mycena epipterygia]
MRSSIICPNLPDEIWLACWTLCSRQQLRRLSLACRFFRSLVLPLLLQHQTLDAAAIANRLSRENWIDRLRHLHRTAVRLDKLKDEPYASLVHSWRVSFAKGGAARPLLPGVQNIQLFGGVNDRVVAKFSTTLGFYQNLSSLCLTHVTVDVSLSETLTSLSRLNDLAFHNCKILTSPGFLPLQRLSLYECDLRNEQDPLLIASPESLRTLKPGSHISRLIPGFGPRRLNQLVNVWLSRLTVQEVDLLFGFFEQCPRLESLTIYTLENHTTLPGVRPNCIPRLRSLAAPSIFHQSLTPGRPISRAEVLRNNGIAEEEDYEHLMRVCCDIARSSVPVRILVLPAPRGAAPNLDFLVGVMALFPELERFSFRVQSRISGEVTFVSCRGYRFRTKTIIEDDGRRPDLNDDVAFDDLPEDPISDDEAEEEPTVIDVKAHQIHELGNAIQPVNLPAPFAWIVGGRLQLPQNIEFIGLEAVLEPYGIRSPSVEPQHQVVAALSALYPSLTGMNFGLMDGWKREGKFWKSQRHTASTSTYTALRNSIWFRSPASELFARSGILSFIAMAIRISRGERIKLKQGLSFLKCTIPHRGLVQERFAESITSARMPALLPQKQVPDFVNQGHLAWPRNFNLEPSLNQSSFAKLRRQYGAEDAMEDGSTEEETTPDAVCAAITGRKGTRTTSKLFIGILARMVWERATQEGRVCRLRIDLKEDQNETWTCRREDNPRRLALQWAEMHRRGYRVAQCRTQDIARWCVRRQDTVSAERQNMPGLPYCRREEGEEEAGCQFAGEYDARGA